MGHFRNLLNFSTFTLPEQYTQPLIEILDSKITINEMNLVLKYFFCKALFYNNQLCNRNTVDVTSTMDGSNMAWRHDRRSHPVTTLPFGIALYYCRIT